MLMFFNSICIRSNMSVVNGLQYIYIYIYIYIVKYGITIRNTIMIVIMIVMVIVVIQMKIIMRRRPAGACRRWRRPSSWGPGSS